MTSTEVEQILVVPTNVFHKLGHVQGFSADVDKYLKELLRPENISYRPRPDMEEDPSFKQLIPYVIFRHTDLEGTVSVFQYSRGAGSGENRLHQKKSVGIGGHISLEDATDADADPYQQGMKRELEEEVRIDTPHRFSLVGLINDDETEVGKVHLGIVHICDVDTPHVVPNEVEIEGNGFVPVAEMLADLTGFETWSAICLKALFS
ncbi:MAG: phosphoesterase [Planctomycetaceae bacterium]|jgi:predicted NUDIX family phosphoesterase|nr:phosphoesterase [Planctomycetaceae bacterium]